jgi:anaerobic selenocysteine-containing dehydrogenase
MAECHPVGFQWVMEAKARGATLIHVDPRFTRTSAMADLHVPLRAGTDIAFLGGIINYVLGGDKFFRDYVLNYTNAATIITEDFADTEDLDGLFSGFDPEHRTYDTRTWQYQGREMQAASGERDELYEDRASMASVRAAGRGEAHGSGGAHVGTPDTDPSLQHPRCVFQILKRHYARYTPEMVEQVCGVPQDAFRRVCELVTENSGRDRTTALVYSVGWTQHTVGVQYIRTAAVLQALLGNIGRPGGGILALRGHASIQGSTDIPTLFDLLPGYIPMPHAHANEDLDAFVAAEGTDKGYWAGMRGLHGEPAEGVVGSGRDGGQRLLLRLPAAADRQPQHLRDRDGPARRALPGLLPARGEPRRRLGERQAAAARARPPGLAGGAGLLADRVRDVLEGQPGDRDRRAADRGHRHRGVLHARRRAHREERELHEHTAAAAVAPPGD